jgi:sugar lactone lactonase YvrE
LARKTLILFFTIAICVFALAEGTRTWEQSKFEELAKGTANGVALRSAGGLELAPTFKPLATTASTYLWSIASDSSGNVYAAAGSPARVYLVTPDGKVTTIFEPQELQVQSRVGGQNGVLYAATAPDGKVYRIARNPGASQTDKTSGFSATPYFEPGTKYIWDLVLDNAGDLYVATGDHGEIFKVTPNGQHSLFFKSDEVHIRVLALDPKGNLIAGSDGSGLIYRIAPNGEAFVLYSAPKKEITALAIDKTGNIYAAAAGEKRPVATGHLNLAPISPAAPSGGVVQFGTAPPLTTPHPSQPAASLPPLPAPGAGAMGGSEIYRIAPDGAPARLWSSHEDLVYALAFDQHGRLLAGSGNRGHIFAIDGLDEFSDLIKASATQITSFAPAPGGGLYASSSNLGKVFLLGPGLESEGSYESDVFDAKAFSRWGRSSMRSTGNVELFARSGNVDNPDRNWSPWIKVNFATGAELNVPPARFVQWKAVLHAGTSASSRVDSVLLYYLPKNIAPVVDDIKVQPGLRYQPIPHVTTSEPAVAGQLRIEPPPPSVRDRDSIGIRWSAHDDNDDQLVYTILYRGDDEARWLLLKDDLSDRFYSFDSSLLPDGGYTVKIIASDAPSHSPGDALTAERESERFEVDTTPPVIEKLTAAPEGKQIHVRFQAADSYSPIKQAEFSLDGGDWQFVEPVGQISDSKTEDYDFRVLIPPIPADVPAGTGDDHVVVVRAYDRFDNLATAKTVLRAH